MSLTSPVAVEHTLSIPSGMWFFPSLRTVFLNDLQDRSFFFPQVSQVFSPSSIIELTQDNSLPPVPVMHLKSPCSASWHLWRLTYQHGGRVLSDLYRAESVTVYSQHKEWLEEHYRGKAGKEQ